jgi:hypothetical protein
LGCFPTIAKSGPVSVIVPSSESSPEQESSKNANKGANKNTLLSVFIILDLKGYQKIKFRLR